MVSSAYSAGSHRFVEAAVALAHRNVAPFKRSRMSRTCLLQQQKKQKKNIKRSAQKLICKIRSHCNSFKIDTETHVPPRHANDKNMANFNGPTETNGETMNPSMKWEYLILMNAVLFVANTLNGWIQCAGSDGINWTPRTILISFCI